MNALYFGICEDIKDPRELGRVRVRCFGIHTHETSQIPTEGLPWASVLQPTTSSANSGVGQTPRIVQGSLVMITFTDPGELQYPIVLGTLPSEILTYGMKIDGLELPRGTKGVGFQDPDGVFPFKNYIGDKDLPKLARNVAPTISVTAGAAVEGPHPYAGQPDQMAIYDRLTPEDQQWAIKDGGRPDLTDSIILSRMPNKGLPAVKSETGRANIPGAAPYGSGSAVIPTSAYRGIEALGKAMDAAGIKGRFARASILGIAMGESKCTPQYEGFKYTEPRLRQIFSWIDDENAKKYASWNGTRDDFFRYIYGPTTPSGRAVGNKSPDDGAMFWGRGYIQLTGRPNYERYARLSGLDLVNQPDICNDYEKGALVTIWYFKDRVKVNENDPSYFEAALKAVGFNAPDIKAKKQAYYEYFLGEAVTPQSAFPAATTPSATTNTLDEFKRRSEQFTNSLFTYTEPGDIRDKHKYPYNQVRQSQAGHHEEWDDTEGNERINTQHKSGTFREFRPDGTCVVKIFKDSYRLIADNENIYIGGDVNVHINGNSNLYVQGNQKTHIAGDLYTQVDGNKIEIVRGNVEQQTFGNNSTLINGTSVENIKGSVNETFGSLTTYADGDVAVDANNIHLNSDVASSSPVEQKATLEPKEYDLEFVQPLINEAGRFAAHDEPDVIDQTPAGYPPDAEKGTGAVQKEAKVGDNKSSTVPASCDLIGDKVDYSLSISTNYKLADFSKNLVFPHDIVAQHGLTTAQIACNLKNLAMNVVEPLRAKYPGCRLNSAFRKGSGKSQHERGQACDLQWPGISSQKYLEIAKWIAENLPFDQLILEHGNNIWLHVSFSTTSNRKQILTMYKGKFEPGLKIYY